MALSDYYNINATVIQWSQTLNETGNLSPTTRTAVTNITLALQQLSKNESFISGTDRIIGTHRAFTAINAAITEERQLLIGTDYYDIEGVENPMQLGRHYEVLLRLVE